MATTLNIILIVFAVVCLLAGLAGAVIPGLPGPPLSWVGLMLLSCSDAAQCFTGCLVTMAVAAVVITVLDYVIPSISTKRFGGGKASVWGCNIGLVVAILGLPFGPQGIIGLIFWPFVGAFVGELIDKKPADEALRAAFGSVLGFLSGTLVKVVYAIIAVIIAIKEVIS